MPPLAPRRLKRKYGGEYQKAGYKKARTVTLYNKGQAAYPVYTSVQKTTLKKNQVELKYDVGSLTDLISNIGSVILLTTIANGVDDFERIGKAINYYDCQGKFYMAPVAVHTGNVITISVVWDSEPHGAIPGYNTIFDTSTPNALPNQDFTNRFKILWQKTFSTTADAPNSLVFNPAPTGDFSINLKGKMATFSGTSNGIADLQKGAVYFTYIASQSNVQQVVLRNKIGFFDA